MYRSFPICKGKGKLWEYSINLRNQIWSMALIFGSYLGEVMLKNGLFKKSFSWEKDDTSNIPLLSDDCGNHITPIDKVYKRLVNGAEDNIVSFYELFMESNF